jgi:2'-hydroxyisoflavone reductase
VITRRAFIVSALAAALAARASRASAADATAASAVPTLLVLGGTGFLGPHIVEAAMRRGHRVTLFNRGKTNPGLFPQLEKLVGDRNTDLHELEGRRWDAVVDTSGYLPSEVTRSAMLLAPNIGRYVFVSTTAVYARLDQPDLDESAPVSTLRDASTEVMTAESFGALKAMCEQAVERALPGRALSLRAGLLAGPGDPTDRFTYWPVRVKRGGEVLCPGRPDDPVQLIDARDFADFALGAIERKLAGPYNVDAPAGALAIGKLIESCKRLLNPKARLTWVPAEFLARSKIAGGTDLPVWSPAEGDEAGFGRLSSAKAIADGLKFRPLDTTIRDTLAWFESQPDERTTLLRAGLAPAREAAVLAAFHAGGKAR